MDDNPFPSLKISDFSYLLDLELRSRCPRCEQSRKFYCYGCGLRLPLLDPYVPYIRLPCRMCMIKDPEEIIGKSTAPHLPALCPIDAEYFVYPNLPTIQDKSRILLMYPATDSCSLSTLVFDHIKICTSDQCLLAKTTEVKSKRSKFDAAECSWRFDTIWFLDATWRRAQKILRDDAFAGLKRIQLFGYPTKFWRWQKGKPSTHLATIEAVYYAACEWFDLVPVDDDRIVEMRKSLLQHYPIPNSTNNTASTSPVESYKRRQINGVYKGELDNILFFFALSYQIVLKSSNGGHAILAYKDEAKAS